MITNAATGNPNVKALVYIAAFAPDEGESSGQLAGMFPGSQLTPENLVFRPFPRDDGLAPGGRHEADPCRLAGDPLTLTARPPSLIAWIRARSRGTTGTFGTGTASATEVDWDLREAPEHRGSVMPHKYALPRTTHTVEMTQIAELNDRLAFRDANESISAADLGLAGAVVLPMPGAAQDGLPGQADLERVGYDGPPEFPYIHAEFRPDRSEAALVRVDLHTDALRKLSRRLHVREVWGVGTADDVGRTGGVPGR